MSWFDTSGLASIAKSALKEAQRTIDKALDIKEEDVTSVPANTPVDTNPDDFFGGWGLTHTGTKEVVQKQQSEEKPSSALTKAPGMATSIWGSFTGSFFEAPNKETSSSSQIKPRDSVESLDDSIDINEHFKSSKLVVQSIEDSESNPRCSEESILEVIEDSSQENLMKTSTNQNINRLSVISNASTKNSSESVEILTGTGCTNTPESEVLSLTQSLSTSSSGLGIKQNSESVEVIFESLNSPSSVEVLGTDCTDNPLSQNTDDFVSPIQSPEENLSAHCSFSPDSVEVITDEKEDISQADESLSISYNSTSENTATVLDQKSHMKVLPSKIMLNPHDTEPIVHPPIKSNQDISILLKNYNVIDIPSELDSSRGSNDSVVISDLNQQLLESTDSQSEKTLTGMESSSDASTTTEINTNSPYATISDSTLNSLYVKTLLADAITEMKENVKDKDKEKENTSEKSEVASQLSSNSSNFETINIRDVSPISSDMVKIGSNQTSAHTSGDELETATSSDIEVISSPNGDSSSTQSRHSPAKLSAAKFSNNKQNQDMNVEILLEKMTFKRAKGHNRELSEASTLSDDCSLNSEIDPLVRRIHEMTEILESREAKLVELGRKYLEVQETNGELRRQLDKVLDERTQNTDWSQVTEEYTQRLSALERKFQQAIREKDSLRKQLDVAKQEAAVRLSKGEIESLIGEKDETILQLREEGEKLSKQQLQHSNIIKKLRAKEKENESTIKHLREKVEELSSESERFKKTLAAKEEVERSQIEAVHQLTAKNKKLEKESAKLQSDHEDLLTKFETVKKALDAAKTELNDKNRANTELMAQEKLLQNLESERKITKSQMEEVTHQLEVLRNKLQEDNAEYVKKEENLKLENKKLLQRLEASERRNEELSQSVLEVSKPLSYQIDSLQASLNKRQAAFEKTESELMMKINELQNKLQSVQVSEKLNKDDNFQLRQKLHDVENNLASEREEKETIKMKLEQTKTELSFLKDEVGRKSENYESQLASANSKVDALDKEIEVLQNRLLQEMEKKKGQENMVTSRSEPVLGQPLQRSSSPNVENMSPTQSVGRASIADSFSSSFWPPDEPFENFSSSRGTNMLEIQLLQTNLRQREGEVQQFQWELNRREHERTILNNEISDLMNRVEALEGSLSNHDALNAQFQQLQKEYDTLCQLYGEKVEETEELKLDLQDVKEMYKLQIDELLKQQKASQPSSSTSSS